VTHTAPVLTSISRVASRKTEGGNEYIMDATDGLLNVFIWRTGGTCRLERMTRNYIGDTESNVGESQTTSSRGVGAEESEPLLKDVRLQFLL
jgi:hypothetical protein